MTEADSSSHMERSGLREATSRRPLGQIGNTPEHAATCQSSQGHCSCIAGTCSSRPHVIQPDRCKVQLFEFGSMYNCATEYITGHSNLFRHIDADGTCLAVHVSPLCHVAKQANCAMQQSKQCITLDTDDTVCSTETSTQRRSVVLRQLIL